MIILIQKFDCIQSILPDEELNEELAIGGNRNFTSLLYDVKIEQHIFPIQVKIFHIGRNARQTIEKAIQENTDGCVLNFSEKTFQHYKIIDNNEQKNAFKEALNTIAFDFEKQFKKEKEIEQAIDAFEIISLPPQKPLRSTIFKYPIIRIDILSVFSTTTWTTTGNPLKKMVERSTTARPQDEPEKTATTLTLSPKASTSGITG